MIIRNEKQRLYEAKQEKIREENQRLYKIQSEYEISEENRRKQEFENEKKRKRWDLINEVSNKLNKDMLYNNKIFKNNFNIGDRVDVYYYNKVYECRLKKAENLLEEQYSKNQNIDLFTIIAEAFVKSLVQDASELFGLDVCKKIKKIEGKVTDKYNNGFEINGTWFSNSDIDSGNYIFFIK